MLGIFVQLLLVEKEIIKWQLEMQKQFGLDP
jgi:hypothetical protein